MAQKAVIIGEHVNTQHHATLAHASIADVVDSAVLGYATGDILCWDDTNSVISPASTFTWTTSLAVTQARFASRFLGIGQFQTKTGELAGTGPVRMRGLAKLPCASAAFKPGTLIGVAKQSGNALERMKVVAVTNPALAIGRVLKKQTTTTEVEFEIWSRYTNGFNPQTLIHEVSFYGKALQTAGDVVTGYSFGRRVKLLSMTAQNIVVPDANTILNLEKNGTNFAGDTLTLVSAAAAVGQLTTVNFDQTLAENEFEGDDLLDIETDGGATGACDALLILRFMDLPLNRAG